VHSCFNALEPFSIAIGSTARSIFHSNPNVNCKCNHLISYRERDVKLECGELYVVARKNTNGYLVPDWNETVEARKTHGPPWIQLVTMARIERAYAFGGDEREARRIEFYGELTQASFLEIGAGLRARA
jgi:hypothetical protein